MIKFNEPFVGGNEAQQISQVISRGICSTGGVSFNACTDILSEYFQSKPVLLTHSCTAALEIVCLLVGLKPGDEVILPSFSFTSTATAIVNVGAKPVFVDVDDEYMLIGPEQIEKAITGATKAICVVHYNGIFPNIEEVVKLAKAHDLILYEDAAQSIGAKFGDSPNGVLSDFATISFHETKNIHCGQGGALVIGNEEYYERAQCILDKGTNRHQFMSGSVEKYTWVDKGSSFSMCEFNAAFLQENFSFIDEVTKHRRNLWLHYKELLCPLVDNGFFIPDLDIGTQRGNGHIFYLVAPTKEIANSVMEVLRNHHVAAVRHYVPLHNSPAGYRYSAPDIILEKTEDFAERLVRLPMHYNLKKENISLICEILLANF